MFSPFVDDEIRGVALDQVGQRARDRFASGLADDVADEQDAAFGHAPCISDRR